MRRLATFALISMFAATPAADAAGANGSSSEIPHGLRSSIANARFDVSQYPPLVTAHPQRVNGPAQKATAAFAIGTLGMLGGLVLGAKLEPPCHCDDPGLIGSMVGAPVGAVLGGILGFRLVK